MAADDDYNNNKVDGNGATGNNDGDRVMGDNNDDNDNGSNDDDDCQEVSDGTQKGTKNLNMK